MMSGRREQQRKYLPDGAFGGEQVRLQYWAVPPSEVIRKLSSGKESDRQYGDDLIHAIEHFVVGKGIMRETRVRRVDSEEGRSMLRFYLRMVGLMQRGKGERAGELRVDGADGYWGRTEMPGARTQRTRLRPTRLRKADDGDVIQPLTFDMASKTFRLNTGARPYHSRTKLVRRYCPKGKTFGLAARHDVTVRTIGNWARFLRVAGFLGCKQPPRTAVDAVLSRRQGDYPYGVWRVLRKLPTKMMQRLQLVWGELQRRAEAVEDLEEQEAKIELSRIQAEGGHERAPPRKRRSELERERTRGESAARELVRGPSI